MADEVHGILLLDKPLRMSSAGAVARAKRLFNARKAGHTGALDPLASGMLPICFGEATKFGARLLDSDKTYRVELRLGQRTPSSDRESEVVETRDLPPISRAFLARALDRFPRSYDQVPPMHSALKQNGKPLYEYARAGITLERAARTVTIRHLALVDWQTPDLTFDVQCTKGAYIRVLGDDLAEALGTIGYLRALRRENVAPFSTEPMWSFDALEAQPTTGLLQYLLPVDAALSGCRRLEVSAADAAALRRGQSVPLRANETGEPGTVRIYAPGFGFLGLGEVEAAGSLIPLRLIAGDVNET